LGKPAVQNAAVVGVPHALAGEQVWAYVVPHPNAPLTPADVLGLCRQELAPFKFPIKPASSRSCRSQAPAKSRNSPCARWPWPKCSNLNREKRPDDPTQEAFVRRVQSFLSDNLGVALPALTRDAHFLNDLAIDSLKLVELILQFELQLGIPVSPDAAWEIQTVGEAYDFYARHTA